MVAYGADQEFWSDWDSQIGDCCSRCGVLLCAMSDNKGGLLPQGGGASPRDPDTGDLTRQSVLVTFWDVVHMQPSTKVTLDF